MQQVEHGYQLICTLFKNYSFACPYYNYHTEVANSLNSINFNNATPLIPGAEHFAPLFIFFYLFMYYYNSIIVQIV